MYGWKRWKTETESALEEKVQLRGERVELLSDFECNAAIENFSFITNKLIDDELWIKFAIGEKAIFQAYVCARGWNSGNVWSSLRSRRDIWNRVRNMITEYHPHRVRMANSV